MYEQMIRMLALRNLPDDWDLGDDQLPVKDRPEVVLGIVAINSAYDSANFTKSIADALEGVLYWNDRSAVDTITRSITVPDAEPEHYIVAVSIPAQATVEQRMAALTEAAHLINSFTRDEMGC